MYLLPFKYSYSQYKREKNQHVFNMFTQVGVKQLTDFLRTVTAASDLVDCTLVNCEYAVQCWYNVLFSYYLLNFKCSLLVILASENIMTNLYFQHLHSKETYVVEIQKLYLSVGLYLAISTIFFDKYVDSS